MSCKIKRKSLCKNMINHKKPRYRANPFAWFVWNKQKIIVCCRKKNKIKINNKAQLVGMFALAAAVLQTAASGGGFIIHIALLACKLQQKAKAKNKRIENESLGKPGLFYFISPAFLSSSIICSLVIFSSWLLS